MLDLNGKGVKTGSAVINYETVPARSFSLLCGVLGTLEHAGNVVAPMHAA